MLLYIQGVDYMLLALDFCNSSGVLKVFYILKLILHIAFIIIPLIIVVILPSDDCFFKL